MIASNTIKFRRVHRKVLAVNGGYAWATSTQVATKDTIIELLGVSLSAWSSWSDLEFDPPVYLDENGNEIPVT